MKKFLLTVIIILSSFIFFLNQSQALELQLANFTPTIDRIVAKKKTTEEKVKFLKSFSDLLTDKSFTQDPKAWLFEDIREYTLNMLNVFQHELQQEQATKSSKTSSKTTSSKASSSTTAKKASIKSLPHLQDNFSNIDEEKVRNAILSWHNDERDSLWLSSYIYNLDLEWAATVWANEIASSWKTKNLHVRNSWDWTYNYNSILNWFYDLWINFPASVKWAASFSESVWYWYYKCSKSDCTQDLINAVKKTRTWLIMNEKSYNWDHYRAAIMKHFTQMWAWIAIDKSNNRYYIVLHYWVNF